MTNRERKTKYRRLLYLCTVVGISHRNTRFGDKPYSTDEELAAYDKLGFLSKDFKPTVSNTPLLNRIELLNLFKELNIPDEEAYELWLHTNWNQRKLRISYREKPIPIRKDNPSLYGEEFNGYGTPRQPRKGRKTAWKRFKKLFPNYISK